MDRDKVLMSDVFERFTVQISSKELEELKSQLAAGKHRADVAEEELEEAKKALSIACEQLGCTCVNDNYLTVNKRVETCVGIDCPRCWENIFLQQAAERLKEKQ